MHGSHIKRKDLRLIVKTIASNKMLRMVNLNFYKFASDNLLMPELCKKLIRNNILENFIPPRNYYFI